MCATFTRQSAALSLSSGAVAFSSRTGWSATASASCRSASAGGPRRRSGCPGRPPAHRLRQLLDARPRLALQQEIRADYLADLLAVGDAELGAGNGAAERPELDARIGIVLVVARVVGELRIADGEILHRLRRFRLRRCRRRSRSLAGGRLVLRLSAARHAQEQRRGKPTGAACRPLSHRRGPSGGRARPGRTW